MSGQHVADADDAAVGVAETTVARLLSKIYASLGFLSKGHLVETDRSGLVAGFVGVTLIVEGFGYHVPKGYIYFAMAFSVGVEVLNIRLRKKRTPPPVKLHEAYTAATDQAGK